MRYCRPLSMKGSQHESTKSVEAYQTHTLACHRTMNLLHAYWHLLCPQLAQVMQPSIMRIS